MDRMLACMGDFILFISVLLVRHSVLCKPNASLKEMMSSQCGGLLEGGALTSDATRKSVMPTAASVVNSHFGLSSIDINTHFSQTVFILFFSAHDFQKKIDMLCLLCSLSAESGNESDGMMLPH